MSLWSAPSLSPKTPVKSFAKPWLAALKKLGGETIRPPRATLSLDVSRLLYILLCVVKAHFYKPECTAGKKKSNRERQTHVWAWLSSCTACHVLPDSMSVMRLDLTLFCFLEKESNPVESKFVVWQVGHCFNSLKWWWGGSLCLVICHTKILRSSVISTFDFQVKVQSHSCFIVGDHRAPVDSRSCLCFTENLQTHIGHMKERWQQVIESQYQGQRKQRKQSVQKAPRYFFSRRNFLFVYCILIYFINHSTPSKVEENWCFHNRPLKVLEIGSNGSFGL